MRLIILATIILALVPSVLLADQTPDPEFLKKLTVEERAWLEEHGDNIRLTYDTTYAPLSFVDEDGKFSGAYADICVLLEDIMGIEFQYVVYETWSEMLDACKSREVDVIDAISTTTGRKEYLKFTSTLYTVPCIIIVNKNASSSIKTAEDLNGKRVAGVKDYGSSVYVANNCPDAELIYVDSELEGLQMIAFGNVDAYVSDTAVASYYMKELSLSNLDLAGYLGFEYKLSFGVRSDYPELLGILNKAQNHIDQEVLDGIYNKWVNISVPDTTAWDKYIRPLLFLLGAVLVVIAGVMVWNRSLQRRVHLKTAELANELAERRKAEEALRDSENRFRTLVENTAEGVVLSDGDFRIRYMNNAAEQILCSSPEERLDVEVRGDTLMRFVHSQDVERITLDPGSALGAGHITHEIRILRSDGTERMVVASLVPLSANGGQVIGMVTTLHDITERLAIEARLNQSQKMEALGTLAGGIAHDFNNLLYAILGNIELAADESKGNPEVSEYLANSLNAGRRASDLVRQILSFARKDEVERIPLQPFTIVKEIVKLLESSVPINITVKSKVGAKQAKIMGDPTQMHQVLMNLCTNAIHAMEGSGGDLTIELVESAPQDTDGGALVERSGCFVCLRVSDTGHGMQQNVVERIFDPFFTTKDKGKGTGMGLAVVHGIIKDMDGIIRVDSTPGLGTTFSIYFPCVEAELAGGEDDGHATPRGNEHIMVIEDERAILNLTQLVLGQLGYRVDGFISPSEAIETLKSHQDDYDLVITDWAMPGMRGDSVAREVISIKPDMPIILCSGYSEYLTAEMAKEIGIRKCIDKPLSKDTLGQAVRQVLSGVQS